MGTLNEFGEILPKGGAVINEYVFLTLLSSHIFCVYLSIF